ncbi:MAG: helix-turn-helix domain-containing protein, partial [Bacilli bacterium]
MERAYYAIIPANVRYDNDLTPNAKLLYGEITALCNEKGFCWASNSYFAELYKVSKETVSRWISNLETLGYIRTELIYEQGT